MELTKQKLCSFGAMPLVSTRYLTLYNVLYAARKIAKKTPTTFTLNFDVCGWGTGDGD